MAECLYLTDEELEAYLLDGYTASGPYSSLGECQTHCTGTGTGTSTGAGGVNTTCCPDDEIATILYIPAGGLGLGPATLIWDPANSWWTGTGGPGVGGATLQFFCTGSGAPWTMRQPGVFSVPGTTTSCSGPFIVDLGIYGTVTDVP